MSSTSPDVCELWNGVGIVRVLGSPSIVQLIIHGDSGRPGTLKPPGSQSVDTLVDTLDTAREKGLYKLKSGGGTGALIESGDNIEGKSTSHHHNVEAHNTTDDPPPNIVLNVSGGIVRRWEVIMAAAVGLILQTGVLVYDGLLVYAPNSILDIEVHSSAYALTAVGTVGMCLGAYICAFVVESSTEEQVWEADSPGGQSSRIVWLQRGQVVGDQAFGSYAIHDTVHEQRIRTSRKLVKKHNEIWTLIGSSLAVVCFVLQFVGLRDMHWSASIAQLLATGIMATVRLLVYRRISMMPKTINLHVGYELDTLAKGIHKCVDWSITAPQETESMPANLLASRVLQTRIRLAKLSGWSSEFAPIVGQLCDAVESFLNHIYRPNKDVVIRQELRHKIEFEWNLGTISRADNEESSHRDLKIVLRRSKSDDKWTPWRIHRGEVEAALSLWLHFHMFQLTSAPSWNLWVIGPNSAVSRIVYDWWIFRGTDRIKIDSVAKTCLGRIISNYRAFDTSDCQKTVLDRKGEGGELLGTVTDDDVPRVCSQFILGCFVKSAVRGIVRLDGKTGIFPAETPGQFLLVNDSVRGMAETLQQGGLVSIEDSYKLVVPALDDVGILPNPLDILEDIVGIAKAQADTGATVHEDDTFQRLILLCQNRAKVWGEQERWAEARKTFLRLIESLTNALGPQAPQTMDAKNAMKKFAIDLVESSPLRSPSEKDRDGDFDEPFRLHAAAAKGLVGQLLRALLDGAGVDTWDDEHETPSSLAIKHGHLDMARLAIFYGAPVDRALLYLAIDDNGRALYPNGDQMVRILLLNLKDQTEVLLEACEKGYGMVELLLEIGIDVTVRDKKGFMPLHLASIHGWHHIVRILLDKGTHVSAQASDGQTALHFAVEKKYYSVIEMLLDAGADMEARDNKRRAPLHIAAAKGFVDIVKDLVRRGADPNGAQGDGQTALHLAARHNETDVIDWLIKNGVNLDARDNDQATALHVATRSQHGKAIAMLVSAGDVMVRAKDMYGQTPLIIASRENGCEPVIRAFIENGADMAARDISGRGSLEYAAFAGHLPVVRLLIENNVSLTNKDGFGRMAIHYASMGNHADIVRLLIDKEADINAVDKDGWTALHYAYCKGNSDVVNLLLEKEAGRPMDRNGHTADYYKNDTLEVNFWTRALPPPYPKASEPMGIQPEAKVLEGQ